MLKKYHVSKNLFDKDAEVLVGNGAVINITETGIKTIVQSQGSNRYSSIQLDNELLGKTITICANITQSASNKGQIRLYYVNGRYATSLIASITTAGQTGYITRTYTMPSSIPSGSDGIAIVLSADREGDGEVGDYVIYADLMIAEGSEPLPYEPYGDTWTEIPYRKYGTETDTLTSLPAEVIADGTNATVGLVGNMSQQSGTTTVPSKSVTVSNLESGTNYALFPKADFPNTVVGDTINIVVNGTSYSQKVMKIDASYVYIENRTV